MTDKQYSIPRDELAADLHESGNKVLRDLGDGFYSNQVAQAQERTSWILDAVESGDAATRRSRVWSYHATITGTGAVSATVLIEARNTSGGWITLGTLTLSGTTSDDDSIETDTPWIEHRARCTAISGTGASVTVTAAGSA